MFVDLQYMKSLNSNTKLYTEYDNVSVIGCFLEPSNLEMLSLYCDVFTRNIVLCNR